MTGVMCAEVRVGLSVHGEGEGDGDGDGEGRWVRLLGGIVKQK